MSALMFVPPRNRPGTIHAKGHGAWPLELRFGRLRCPFGRFALPLRGLVEAEFFRVVTKSGPAESGPPAEFGGTSEMYAFVGVSDIGQEAVMGDFERLDGNLWPLSTELRAGPQQYVTNQ